MRMNRKNAIVIILAVEVMVLILLGLIVSFPYLNKPLNIPEGAITEGRIIERCNDGIVCIEYNLLNIECFSEGKLIQKYCENEN